MSREDNGLQKAISRLSGAEGTIHLAEMEATPSRQQSQALKASTDSSEDLAKDSLEKDDGPAVVEGDLEAGKAFELTDQTLVSGMNPPGSFCSFCDTKVSEAAATVFGWC